MHGVDYGINNTELKEDGIYSRVPPQPRGLPPEGRSELNDVPEHSTED
jgi:hypothetical protein